MENIRNNLRDYAVDWKVQAIIVICITAIAVSAMLTHQDSIVYGALFGLIPTPIALIWHVHKIGDKLVTSVYAQLSNIDTNLDGKISLAELTNTINILAAELRSDFLSNQNNKGNE